MGKNHIWKYFSDLACGAIFCMIIYKQQFLLSDWLKTCQLIPDQWNFISATLNHIRFVFVFITLSKITKEIRFVDNWKHRLGLESARAALCKWATCTRQTFLSKTFAKSLNIRKQYEKNVWENSSDAYSLSIRVQTTINHISIFTFLCFLWQYQRQRKCFLSKRELRMALRDTLTRAAWLGPGNFWLVRSEHAHASYPGLFFCPPGFSPYMGREERRVQGLDYAYPSRDVFERDPYLWRLLSQEANLSFRS